MKNALLLLLLLVAAAMIFLGIQNSMMPPILTGAGFVVIALLFYNQKNS